MCSPDKRAVGLPASLAASPSNIVNKNNTQSLRQCCIKLLNRNKVRNPDKRVVGLPASLAASPSNVVNKITHINYANVALNQHWHL